MRANNEALFIKTGLSGDVQILLCSVNKDVLSYVLYIVINDGHYDY